MSDKKNELVASALRSYAKRMCDSPDAYSEEQGKELDRALRTCKGISDIDVVWVRWRYVGETRNWITDNELKFKNGRYSY